MSQSMQPISSDQIISLQSQPTPIQQRILDAIEQEESDHDDFQETAQKICNLMKMLWDFHVYGREVEDRASGGRNRDWHQPFHISNYIEILGDEVHGNIHLRTEEAGTGRRNWAEVYHGRAQNWLSRFMRLSAHLRADELDAILGLLGRPLIGRHVLQLPSQINSRALNLPSEIGRGDRDVLYRLAEQCIEGQVPPTVPLNEYWAKRHRDEESRLAFLASSFPLLEYSFGGIRKPWGMLTEMRLELMEANLSRRTSSEARHPSIATLSPFQNAMLHVIEVAERQHIAFQSIAQKVCNILSIFHEGLLHTAAVQAVLTLPRQGNFDLTQQIAGLERGPGGCTYFLKKRGGLNWAEIYHQQVLGRLTALLRLPSSPSFTPEGFRDLLFPLRIRQINAENAVACYIAPTEIVHQIGEYLSDDLGSFIPDNCNLARISDGPNFYEDVPSCVTQNPEDRGQTLRYMGPSSGRLVHVFRAFPLFTVHPITSAATPTVSFFSFGQERMPFSPTEELNFSIMISNLRGLLA